MSLKQLSFRKALSSETISVKKDVDHDVTFEIMGLYDKLLKMKRKPRYITILFNSLGGDVDALLNFRDIVNRIKALEIEIITICVGAARSAAFDMYMDGDYRASMPAPNFMTHTAYLCAHPLVQFRHRQISKMRKELTECETMAPLSPEVKLSSAQQKLFDANEEVEMNYNEAVLANVVNTELV